MSTDGAPQEITSLVGREVYSNNGVFVGKVEDVRLDLHEEAVTGIALGELNDELFGARVGPREGVMVPYRWVRAVGDVILINDVVERLRSEDEDEEQVPPSA
ncbi:PRC-barrel domain-containing protein [Halobaculum sp. MBLA0147]|uniref:PRC-barrel domain-containing protein n=1 Tax=Halobaculum sp. MBLA0147 TaxID=3079934 RepID=UPI003523EEBE